MPGHHHNRQVTSKEQSSISALLISTWGTNGHYNIIYNYVLYINILSCYILLYLLYYFNDLPQNGVRPEMNMFRNDQGSSARPHFQPHLPLSVQSGDPA